MNLVKRSLYLCIGTLLALLALQGVQSVYQISRLADATKAVLATDALSGQARTVWTRFVAADQAWADATVALLDVATAEAKRRTFEAQATTLRGELRAARGQGVDA